MDGEALELPADTFDASASLNGVSLFPDVAGQLTRDVSDAQRTEVKQVLDRMFRERSGGQPEAVISTRMNIGTGTA